MPSLIERTASLRAAYSTLTESRAEATRLERLNTRAEQINDAASQLGEAYAALRLLVERRQSPKSVPNPSAALRAKGPQLQAELAENWHAFVDRTDIGSYFVDRLINHADKLREACRSSWQVYVDSGLPDIREDFLLALQGGGFRDECAQLRLLRGEVASLRSKLPLSDDAFDHAAKLKAQIQEVWDRLKGVPPDVITFLKKASERQATFADLTAEIRSWLEGHDMLSKLRIGLG